ncbi:hypothetical protein [Nocardia farcinica]|uniref:hypothetical protein n=1 Tax=Nocardia farcinica TaxID=37329 RepID=UPI0037A1BFF6
MTAPLRPGEQLASTVCGTRVVVVRAPAGTAPQLACGGAPLAAGGSAQAARPDGGPHATLIGKRYVNADESVELLCTAPGSGELTCDGVPMTVKAAKALPASD